MYEINTRFFVTDFSRPILSGYLKIRNVVSRYVLTEISL